MASCPNEDAAYDGGAKSGDGKECYVTGKGKLEKTQRMALIALRQLCGAIFV